MKAHERQERNKANDGTSAMSHRAHRMKYGARSRARTNQQIARELNRDADADRALRKRQRGPMFGSIRDLFGGTQ